MKKLIMSAVVAAAACGCISVNQNDGGSACRQAGVIKDVIREKFTVAQETVSAVDDIKCLFGVFCWGSSSTHLADCVCEGRSTLPIIGFFDNRGIKQAKNGAYANACDAANCDQIVAAKYKVTTEDYYVFKKIRAEITGYPAKVSGVEVIENKEIPCSKGK